MVTIPSLRTIPKAPKLGKKNHRKKVLNWAKKGANLEASRDKASSGSQSLRRKETTVVKYTEATNEPGWKIICFISVNGISIFLVFITSWSLSFYSIYYVN